MSSETNKTLKCNHLNILDDNGEGNTVCITCGLVLEPIYSYNQTYITTNTEDEKYITKDGSNKEKEKLLVQRKNEIELIKTLQELWHFPPHVITQTINLFLKIAKNKKQLHKKTHFAFAFYKSLFDNKCSHSINEICYLFGISSIKTFSKIAFHEEIEFPPNISDFLDRFCSYLEFNFKQRQKIFNILQKIKFPPNIKPETICALIILHYHKKEKTKWNAKEIAHRCEITYQTLQKNYSNFKHIFY